MDGGFESLNSAEFMKIFSQRLRAEIGRGSAENIELSIKEGTRCYEEVEIATLRGPYAADGSETDNTTEPTGRLILTATPATSERYRSFGVDHTRNGPETHFIRIGWGRGL